MRKIIVPLFLLMGFLAASSCTPKSALTNLFNGQNLDNWDKYLGSGYEGHEDLGAAATPENVFSVVTEDGCQVIRISGEVKGSLATKGSFRDYHLRVVYKWGDKVTQQRNGGLLYHGYGDLGAALGTWMASVECQMMHDNPGDTFFIGDNIECCTRAGQVEKGYVYQPDAEKLPFGKRHNRRSIQKSQNAEKPVGEWNTIDLYCLGQTAVHVVNGITVMVNQDLSVYSDQGLTPLSSGKIQLQSEGGELFIKEISLETITALPKDI